MGSLFHTSDWISTLQRNLQARAEGIPGKSSKHPDFAYMDWEGLWSKDSSGFLYS